MAASTANDTLIPRGNPVLFNKFLYKCKGLTTYNIATKVMAN